MTDPTPEDVERVALAIERADREPVPFCPSDHPEISDWGWHMARAALTAMPDHSALIRELRDALDSILTGGNHLALNLIDKLGADFAKAMPPEMNSEVAQEEIDDPAVFNIWVCWQRIMLARAALRKANEVLGEKP